MATVSKHVNTLMFGTATKFLTQAVTKFHKFITNILRDYFICINYLSFFTMPTYLLKFLL